ncbi:MAG: apolipoprotein N-acyltransferase [Succinivibrio sp.]
MFKLIVFLMNALDGSRLLGIVTSKWGALVSSVILGYLYSFSVAPFSIWPFAIIAYVFVMMQLSAAKSKKRVFFLTLFFFATYSTVTLSWLNFVMEGFGQLPAVLSNTVVVLFSIFYIALPYALLNTAAFALSKGRKAVFTVCFMPLAFIAADFVTGYLFSGFPWLYSGYSCTQGPLKNYAPFVGVRAISALIYIMSGAIALTALRRFLFLPVAAVILLFGILLEGVSFVTPQKSFSVTMMQGNLEQSVTNDTSKVQEVVSTYWSLTEDILEKDRLVIWPESSMPFAIEYASPLISALNEKVSHKGSVLVSGVLSTPDRGEHAYNSIVTMGIGHDPDNLPLYNKRALVPFGEIIPFASLLRPLGSIFAIPNSSFSYGADKQDPIRVFSHDFIPAICYESIFPELIRDMDGENINGIIMISNDTWFGPTKAPMQHLNIAKMRALELQKPMLRATNSGITAYIDEFGNTKSTCDADIKTRLDVSFVPVTGQTPYSRFGNLALYIIMLLLLSAGIIGLFHKEDSLSEQMNRLIRP